MLGRSVGGIELGLPTQFHHCCVSIGIVFFTGIGGDINIASWARYKFIERFRLFTRSPAVVTKTQREQPTSTTAIADSTWTPIHPAISLSAKWRNWRAASECGRLGKLWLRERTAEDISFWRRIPFYPLDVTGRINDVEALWCSLLARWIEKGGGSVINAVRDAWVLIVGRIHGRLTRRLQPSLLLLQ